VFNRQLTFITYRLVLAVVFVINFFVIVAVLPSIIKFGNWYSKTLKEMYYEDEEGERIALARRMDKE
jgi:hypothetical protein